ncbi:MOSC domain-containing protein [Modestobacter sp. DSM 44400]|uniref:MOSC domain-containing protein n=1 Tax=Modestobacter sp. DSM 44400 TaxID=1550230 RepID=UPI000B8789D8
MGCCRYRAHLDGQREPLVVFPQGPATGAGDAATDRLMSAAVGRPVQLRRESDIRHRDESPVHVLTTGSVEHLSRLVGQPIDAQRFRGNVLIETVASDGFVEDSWIGRRPRPPAGGCRPTSRAPAPSGTGTWSGRCEQRRPRCSRTYP